MDVCICGQGLSNIGTPGCEPIGGIAKKLIITALTGDDGVRNRILLDDTLDETYFSDFVNQTDASKRWLPTPLVENVEDIRDESIKQALNSGSALFVQQGIRNFTAVLTRESSVLLGKLEAVRCFEVGVYVVDKNGNLHGNISSDKLYLEPIPIDSGSWDPILVKATDAEVQMIQLNYAFSSLAKDADLRMILASEIVDFQLLSLKGLLDVNVAVSAIIATAFLAKLTLDYGSAKNPILVKKWITGDFTLFNETTSLAVVVVASEAPDGSYTLTYIAQTAADVLTLSATKTGFEIPDTTIIAV